ncbi:MULTISPECIES: NAD(P)/FAD-dependent oxidoreductase [unclassified Sphingomonas]|uniref:NAD(P)/FAD-dependent oxidoreductase n=1 Tax=unclassified Sphingomonas TaxID=196159 RepID=UPI0006FAD83B|nr:MULTISPECIES: FAD-dependent oxidoreductase [unclassified Sphingomonas]KQX25017.1 pyridine nucleotide-disulfide oxidoreductase [Sphingomonas sp. Root1294]KQY66034.1 pyridine nucleotide-disulfide oxidoreductase [Sphingomonas sp. Root50]KRB89801.1 pyridine nucleotide-disulfide oxidoreductase [Sphingomonas sp. Root720]
MPRNILIVGSGFAGTMAALEASRMRDEKGVSPDELAITVVSPEPVMVIRPRLYERNPETMVAPLTDLFAATDIRHHVGRVEAIDNGASTITVAASDGSTSSLPYERLVLAAGSEGFSPPIPGLAEFGFAATQLDEAVMLDRHLQGLAEKAASPGRNTVVVGGAGFTGLEYATEMPARLREILGEDSAVRVVIVDRSDHVAAAMGDEPRPFIEERLRALGIETRLNVGVAALDADGVTLSDGERIETSTVIWSGGMRASPLTAQLPADRDNLGRTIVEPDLRVPGAPKIFATGDTAKAQTDSQGNVAAMSCQHARRLGAFAGHNAAADLLGEPTLPYDQPAYVVCLDLGPDHAIFARGWDSKVEVTGAQAKGIKKEINEVWIYPPAADRAAAYENVLAARTIDF